MIRKKYNNQNKNRHGGGHRRYNNNQGGGGGNRNDGQNIARQKHHAMQMREKFSNMARDAQNNGDRVDVEYYLQHVDHYTRVLADIAAIEAERFTHQREQQQNQPAAEGGDAVPVEGDAAASDGSDTQNFNPSNNQPRMTRPPRHQRPQQPPAGESGEGKPAEGGDDAAGDIPLPGLPTI